MQKERENLAITNFAISIEIVNVGNDQWLPKFLDERVMGNFKMEESGERHLNPKINLKSLRVGQLTLCVSWCDTTKVYDTTYNVFLKKKKNWTWIFSGISNLTTCLKKI